MLDLKSLSERINAYVRENNTTKEAFADKLKMTYVTLQNKLGGKTRFYTDEYIKICDLLGVADLNYFRIR